MRIIEDRIGDPCKNAMSQAMKSKVASGPAPAYSTEFGQAFLGDSLTFLDRVSDGAVDLILTSPPFPLRRKKAYGNETEDAYVDWFMSFVPGFRRVLSDTGSLVIDLGGTYVPNAPVRSIYQFELLVRLVRQAGFFLAQDLYHHNPARLPSPIEWVNKRRVRLKDSVNVVWWLSKTPHPKADNRRVLRPYSAHMQSLLRKGTTERLRPSGHKICRSFEVDNGGAIAPSLLEISNTDSNGAYLRACKAAGIKPHPARFPPAFAEFFVKFLTEEGDVVFDPFSGSNTTGWVAEELGRRWIASERDPDYVAGGRLRFSGATSTEPREHKAAA